MDRKLKVLTYCPLDLHENISIKFFPGTMPLSEGIGFIIDLHYVIKNDTDIVLNVVGYEKANQYWTNKA